MIDKIKNNIILSNEIGKYIKLTKKGNVFWCLCPFHTEKTQSFVINNEKQFFYCFGCGEHGDIFKFYQLYFNKSFQEIVEMLAKSLGIKIDYKLIQAHNKDFELLDLAKNYYKSQINENIMQYLNNRGLSNEMIDKFDIGFSNGSLNYFFEHNYTLLDLQNVGICSSHLDLLRNRLIIPIKNKKSQVIGFSGRVLDNSLPKYINSPETTIFHKSYHVFGEQLLEYNQPIFLVEGYLDVIMMYQHGFTNVVAAMGTNISIQQLQMLLNHSKIIYILLDGDKSGLRAIKKTIDLLLTIIESDHVIKIIELPNNYDPQEILLKFGKTQLEKYINHAYTLNEWLWKWLLLQYPIRLPLQKNTPDKIASFLSNIDELINHISNRYIKSAFRMFFKQKTRQKYENTTTNRNLIQKFSSEDLIIGILIFYPEILDEILENLMIYTFQIKIYENIKCEIIDFITLDNHDPKICVEKILIKYAQDLDFLIKNRHLYFIIPNRSFAIQYVKDFLSHGIKKERGRGLFLHIPKLSMEYK